MQKANMKIVGFKDVAFSQQVASGIELQFNPQEVEFGYSIEGAENNTAGGESAPTPINRNIKASDLKINTMVDATGVVPYEAIPMSPSGDGVIPFIEALKQEIYYYVNDSHCPPYVQITWGKLTESTDTRKAYKTFRGTLKDLNIKFTLFSLTGVPIRAEIDMTFEWAEDPTGRPTGESPDLTHFIEVKYGDNLPALCQKIYKDPNFFMQVARINNLNSVYDLQPGTRLIFPPLEKASR